MKQIIHKPGDMHWFVMYYNSNAKQFQPYDILKYREEFIKNLKKKCETKEEFSEKLRREFQRMYWSRAEWELVIVKESDDSIWLVPWVGCCNKEEVKINVTNDISFDWKSFAKQHIQSQIDGNRAKIDVFDQLTFGDQFEKLVDYCWYTRWKYERMDPKFEK